MATGTPTVDIVIPVYRGWELTRRCLDSLEHRDACVRRVIVVDDASPPDDPGPRELRRRDCVDAIFLTANAGFAGACNAGAAVATADAIFFLNNDTLVEPGTIERLAETLAEAEVGAVMPKLLNGDGTLQCAGLALLPGRTNFFRLFVHLDADLAEANVPYDPIALMGAALLVRRDVFERVGTFDTAYRNGNEDTDLCARIWAAGYRCRYEPRAHVVHLEGATRGRSFDNTANERRFDRAWGARFSGVPRWQERPAPVIAVGWHSRSALDHIVRRHIMRTLRAYAGARVLDAGPFAGALARLDGRPLLRLSHGGRRASDVRLCAPYNVAEASAEVMVGSKRYWVPTRHARSLLIRAGAPHASVSVIALGWAARDVPPREFTHGVLIADDDASVTEIADIRAACAPRPVECVRVGTVDEAAFARIIHAPYVVIAGDADAWGALGSAALAAGALVIAVAGAPFLAFTPRDAYVAVDHRSQLADAVHAALNDDRCAETGAYASREMARRNPDANFGRRVRELGRAIVHGVIDPRTLAIDDALARSFRI